MKKGVFFILILVAITSVYALTIPDSSTILQMHLDGNAQDASGGNDGTIVGANCNAPGKFDKACSFDGVDDYILISNREDFENLNAFTIAAWVKPQGPQGDNDVRIISKNKGESDDDFALVVSNTDNRLNFRTRHGGLENLRVNDPLIISGSWYHVVGTWDGVTKKVYVNGDFKKQHVVGSPLEDNNGDLTIGGMGGVSSGRKFNGIIDEVVVFDRALSSSEIQELFEAVPGEVVEEPVTEEEIVPEILDDEIQEPMPTGGGVPEAVIIASRTDCTAPCAIFFEGTDSSDANGNKIGHHDGSGNPTGQGLLGNDIAKYQWDFDDNDETFDGFNAAHVFNTSGTYDVSLVVIDKDDLSSDPFVVQITVQPEESLETICLSGDGDFDYPECQDAQTFTDPNVDNYVQSSNRRVLLKRGFDYNGQVSFGGNNILLGAFGTCNPSTNPEEETRGICENAPVISGGDPVIRGGKTFGPYSQRQE